MRRQEVEMCAISIENSKVVQRLSIELLGWFSNVSVTRQAKFVIQEKDIFP